ncbi:E3 ubiquitin-protein ligase TRIM71-like [Oopsacas minuta]|uniref:E3 ubiquitin-protein ligase TRIM71-like n=1 Tax=Oopsacas minuta TaxID=111878 RepID=A0AAV7K402_9METZ|nr:E3 ubiquitin-protein ligase TRIM71-like [Oopsacas minuta]
MASIEAIVEDRFLSLVNSARSEIRNKFKRTHEVLRAREAALLDKFEDEYMGVSIAEYNQQLSISKDGLKDALKGNENKEFLDQNLDMIDARIDELENRALTAKHSCKNVVLEWDVELEKKLSVTGDIHLNSMKDIRDYKKLGEPVATFGKHRNTPESSPGVFYYPSGIANNPVNTFIEQMNFPFGICINQNQFYVTQYGSNSLTVYSTEGKYLQSVGGKWKNELEFDKPRGVDYSTEMNRIYIAEKGNDRVHCLNSDLTFHSFIDNILGARNVKLTSKEIIVLCDRNPCVSIFSYSHQLIREIIPRGKGYRLVNRPSQSVLDEDFNFLISDYNSNCICVCSYEREFIHKFGKEAGERGNFIHPQALLSALKEELSLLLMIPPIVYGYSDLNIRVLIFLYIIFYQILLVIL